MINNSFQSSPNKINNDLGVDSVSLSDYEGGENPDEYAEDSDGNFFFEGGKKKSKSKGEKKSKSDKKSKKKSVNFSKNQDEIVAMPINLKKQGTNFKIHNKMQ